MRDRGIVGNGPDVRVLGVMEVVFRPGADTAYTALNKKEYETRIDYSLLDGEPLGAILRVPRADEARSNIHVGGRVEPTELSAADQAIVKRLAPKPMKRPKRFVL